MPPISCEPRAGARMNRQLTEPPRRPSQATREAKRLLISNQRISRLAHCLSKAPQDTAEQVHRDRAGADLEVRVQRHAGDQPELGGHFDEMGGVDGTTGLVE